MYHLSIIERVEPIQDDSKKPWFRYIISNAHNTITGYRCGTESEVHRFAKEFIKDLNHKYPGGTPRYVNPVQIHYQPDCP
jgi:hypothetical protein